MYVTFFFRGLVGKKNGNICGILLLYLAITSCSLKPQNLLDKERVESKIELIVYTKAIENTSFCLVQYDFDSSVVKMDSIRTPFNIKYGSEKELLTIIIRSKENVSALIKQQGKDRVGANGKNIFLIIHRPKRKKQNKSKYYSYSY